MFQIVERSEMLGEACSRCGPTHVCAGEQSIRGECAVDGAGTHRDAAQLVFSMTCSMWSCMYLLYTV
jgi:hypothetical protein